MANIKLLLPFISQWEGGYVNDPDDKGGETNRGITIATWKAFGYDTSEKIQKLQVGSKTYYNVTKSLYNMTDAQWEDIVKRGYWDKWKADSINSQGLANILVDWVWASGVVGIKRPQELLGVTADGVVGPKTLAALNAFEPKQFFEVVKKARLSFIDEIIARTPSNAKFEKGWKNRINSLTL